MEELQGQQENEDNASSAIVIESENQNQPSPIVESFSTPIMNVAASSGIPLHLLKKFCGTLKASDQQFFLSDDVQERLNCFLSLEALEDRERKAVLRVFRGCSEIVLDGDAAFAVLRPGIGRKQIICIHPELDDIELVERRRFLEIKDALVQGHDEASRPRLCIDFSPFFRNYPRVANPREMGQGISLLNRHLSAQLTQKPTIFQRELLEFMKHRQLDQTSILVNEHLATPEVMLRELSNVLLLLEDYQEDEPFDHVAHELRKHGFESGWGNCVGRIIQNLNLLVDVFESPSPAQLERLLTRLPLIRTVLMVSPHGWLAQDDVLGKPDTGGQVTYVLDQALAFEHELRRHYEHAGVVATPKVAILTRLIPDSEGTTCNVVREKIIGTQDSWIIRVPFRNPGGEVIENWISRFQLWPYLEDFAAESRQMVVTELVGKPDLIIGHYSDGNLVAHRLAEDLDTTHCACIHALEKTKYALSDLHWADLEEDYHFSLQFLADLLAYNSADFIVSSSYREVGGTPSEMGMIESYELFTMPGLFRVQSGFDPRLARHNIVPPGASPKYFFPFTERSRRIEALTARLTERFLESQPDENGFGELAHPERPCVFAMARIDRIKNLSGLVEVFGQHESLRNTANLLLITSVNQIVDASDHEEIEEVRKIYELIERYELERQVRWCAARLDKVETGEIYRLVADGHGVFAQPALMETFGLTVVEAMACGLPVVVTCFGGPAEIVETGLSGEVQNPNQHQKFGDALYRIISDKPTWDRYSSSGIERVESQFTWKRHAQRVSSLANVYSYWNHIDIMNRQALDQYIHTLYHTVYRPRAGKLL